jgi:hypothetical protein
MSTERPELSRRALAAEQLGTAAAALHVAAKLIADDADVRQELGFIVAANLLVDDVRLALRSPDWDAAAEPAIGYAVDVGDPGA